MLSPIANKHVCMPVRTDANIQLPYVYTATYSISCANVNVQAHSQDGKLQ